MTHRPAHPVSGLALLAVIAGTLARALFGLDGVGRAGDAALLLFLALEWPRIPVFGKACAAIALAIAILVAAALAAPLPVLARALDRAGYIATFFAVLGYLRDAASTSPLVRRCGRHVVAQPSGRRYLALAVGTHLFAVILNFGAMNLLGAMILAGTRGNAPGTDPGARTLAERRMMSAMHRGFTVVTSWSPTSISVPTVLSVLPTLSWAAIAPFCAVTAAGLTAIGWALDRIAFPRAARSGPAQPPAPPAERWTVHLGVVLLVGTILGAALLVEAALRTTMIIGVIVAVPAIGTGWILVQKARRGARLALALTARRLGRHVLAIFPTYRLEVAILGSAIFAGFALQPLIPAESLARAYQGLGLPAALIPAAAPWLVVLLGFLGVNQVAVVILLGAVLGDVRALGVEPAALAVALTGGWALGSASSPFGASILTVVRLTGYPAARITARWNGPYTLAGLIAVSAWVVAIQALAGP
ncbi:MAG: hypothetical protein HY521_03985 [Proteobacteria bacterium]|nr:hypothetical protein [Pseudomonadota bacterium]